jgi:oxygen-independent coproporphyrinogen-3 oxidase
MKTPIDIGRLLACADRDSLPETPPNYPPMAAWPPLKRDTKKILSAWRRSLANDGGRRPVVYVHVPFCETLCRFCGFYKLPAAPGAVDRYLDALEKETALVGPLFKGRPLRFLCIGGGTPSLLTIPQLERLFALLRRHFRITPATRIAFESSPNTLDPEKLAFLKRYGVEWLAIGVQSFDPALLKALNRRQDPARTLSVIKQAKAAGIKQVEVDLMAGLPGQTAESFLSDVKKAAALDVERVYLFDFQPRCNTSAGERAGSLPAGALEAARGWRRRGMAILTSNGYRMRCGHWVYKRKGDCWPYSYDQGEEGSYSVLGLGPSAISYAFGAARYRNAADEAAYERAAGRRELPLAAGALLTERDEMVNFFLLDALHRGQVNKRLFLRRFGRGLSEVFSAEVAAAKKTGLAADSGGALLITDRGRATTDLRRLLYSPAVIERLAKLYGRGAAPAAAPRAEHKAAFNKQGGAHECLLQANALGALLYGEAAGAARPSREIALELLKAADKKEALIISAAAPGTEELAAARYAARAGFKKIKLFSRLPADGAMAARLKAAGVSEQFFVMGGGGPVKASAKAGLKLTGVYVPRDGKNAAAPAAMKILAVAGVKEFIVSFPEGREHIKADYTALAPLARAAARRGAGFLRAPLCVIYPDWESSLDRLRGASGDARESGGDAGAVKPRLCLHCRFLLDCPGPARGYAEVYGFKGLKTIK